MKVALRVGFIVLVAGLMPAAAKDPVDRITAVAIGTGGPLGGRSIQLSIRIDEYTSDQELQRLAEVLAEKGGDALRKEMEKLKVGRIAPSGRVGNDIAVARSRKTDTGRRILIVTARNMSFMELRRGGRSTEYPFGWMQIDVDDEGKGQGTVIVAGRVSFNKEGGLAVESLGQQNVRLTNVRVRK